MPSSSFSSGNGHQVRVANPSCFSIVFLALSESKFSFDNFSFIGIFFLRASSEIMVIMVVLMKRQTKIATFLSGVVGGHVLCTCHCATCFM